MLRTGIARHRNTHDHRFRDIPGRLPSPARDSFQRDMHALYLLELGLAIRSGNLDENAVVFQSEPDRNQRSFVS